MDNHNHAHSWYNSQYPNLELVHASYTTHTFAPHTHDTYMFGFVETGAEQFRYRGKNYVAPAGSIVLLNPGEMHTGSSAHEHGWTYRALYPPPDLVQRAATELIGRASGIPYFPAPVLEDPELMNQLSHLHRAFFEEQTSALERETQLLWVLARMILRHAEHRPHIKQPAKEHCGIDRVREYLEENYSENISLTQLAAIAQLSPFHLLRLFRDQTHLPPHAYQIQIRIRHARQFLRAGTSCADTALLVGFADQSHFTKHFKRIVGVPPGLYSTAQKKIAISDKTFH